MEAPSCIRNGLHSYTYNQEVAPNKSSRLIPKAGHKALYLKSALVSNRPLTVAAYHNGNGSVTLGLSTTNGQQHFDRVLRNSSDIKWHKSLQGGDRAATCNKWYQHYGRCRGDTSNFSADDKLVASLQDRVIDPIITECNNSGWFICRGNSSTFSTGEKSIHVVFSTPEEDLESAGMAGIHINHLEEYLKP